MQCVTMCVSLLEMLCVMLCVRGRPHMISHLWVGGYVLENLISPIKNELYTSEKSDMGGWVGQKWPKKSDIICGWPLMESF